MGAVRSDLLSKASSILSRRPSIELFHMFHGDGLRMLVGNMVAAPTDRGKGGGGGGVPRLTIAPNVAKMRPRIVCGRGTAFGKTLIERIVCVENWF